MKQIYTSFCLLLFVATNAVAQQTSVLFLGNSYTATQNLPATFSNLALEAGDSIYYESNTPGGYTLNGHSSNSTSLNQISSRNWDFVVMQEQSQLPSFPDGQVATEVYPYAAILVDSIKSNYECTEPVFFMTWGRRDGDQQNCAGFPPLCTYEGMQERLRNAYLQMTFDNEATVAPCGAAWQQMAIVNNSFWNGLYSNDGSHPSAWGTYLNACVFYATLLRKSPVGIPYYASIGQADAEALQQLAEDIVLDSLSVWNIGHADVIAAASFSSDGSSSLFDFENTSVNATDHYWDFGDGTNSTESDPQHFYSTPSVYDGFYIASSNCSSDTIYFSVPTFLSIEESELFKDISLMQDESGISIFNQTNVEFDLQLIDVTGRLVADRMLKPNSQLHLDNILESGFNLIRLNTKEVSRTYKVVKK